MNRYDNIRVAVGMATYNTDKKMLQEAIDSVLHQSHSNFTFYIVNDSGYNIEQLKMIKDERITIIQHDSKMGLAKSMNEIIDIMDEKYFFRMDSDDISLPDRLLKQITFLEENDSIDVVSMCGMRFGSESGPVYPIWSDSDHINALLLFTNAFIHSSVAFRTDFLKRTGIRYDEKFMATQDYDLWNRCGRITKICSIPQVGVYYRMHKNQVSSDRKETQNFFFHMVMERNLQELGFDISNAEYLDILAGKCQISDLESFTRFITELLRQNEKLLRYDTKSLTEVICFYYFRSVCNAHLLGKAILNKECRNKIIRYSNIKNLLMMYRKRKQLEKQTRKVCLQASS